ncbi:hypothetical protein HY523_02055 [Candidatus Berkelbacteria bacterium]|nr:hypothetical protein [Candidatus Berkelbacteria bacterium]
MRYAFQVTSHEPHFPSLFRDSLVLALMDLKDQAGSACRLIVTDGERVVSYEVLERLKGFLMVMLKEVVTALGHGGYPRTEPLSRLIEDLKDTRLFLPRMVPDDWRQIWQEEAVQLIGWGNNSQGHEIAPDFEVQKLLVQMIIDGDPITAAGLCATALFHHPYNANRPGLGAEFQSLVEANLEWLFAFAQTGLGNPTSGVGYQA